MIDSVMELVNKTTSNSLFMFLFCNFIIILILMGNYKPGSQDKSNPGSLMFSDSVLSSKPGFENSVLKSESNVSPKPGYEKSGLISGPVPSYKPSFQISVLVPKSNLISKPGLQEPGLIPKSTLSSKPAGSEQSLTSKPGLGLSEKDEKGSLVVEEENESEMEVVLRRRVEEFIRKVNTQWKSENTKTNYLLH
ncbi:PREDICTED: uncharacterized protein LOC109130536 isoform X2 [Camelina sativa]|uniref:Uncharacterized protein LOC109130536 isoform X2 n=1 Tax=Camelina sativa TaxID=90675 RepID=A0ABM1R9N4_CAMSA|nr:PREDICTED: uncharacterized protein LOC109130536 isoform X2 [Camelina sativa]